MYLPGLRGWITLKWQSSATYGSMVAGGSPCLHAWAAV